jgi:hypothetical protein
MYVCVCVCVCVCARARARAHVCLCANVRTGNYIMGLKVSPNFPPFPPLPPDLSSFLLLFHVFYVQCLQNCCLSVSVSDDILNMFSPFFSVFLFWHEYICVLIISIVKKTCESYDACNSAMVADIVKPSIPLCRARMKASDWMRDVPHWWRHQPPWGPLTEGMIWCSQLISELRCT